jgi:hypothetical protein
MSEEAADILTYLQAQAKGIRLRYELPDDAPLTLKVPPLLYTALGPHPDGLANVTIEVDPRLKQPGSLRARFRSMFRRVTPKEG